MSKRQQPLTAWFWTVYCRVWDNRCLAPDCPNPTGNELLASPLVRDHIISFADGGPGDLWNIQPLCRSCNSRYRRNSQDWRGEGWREKLLALLAQELAANCDIYRIGGCAATYAHVAGHTGSADAPENDGLTLLYSPQNTASKGTNEHIVDHHINIKCSKQEATALINRLIVRLHENPFVTRTDIPYNPPPFPPERRQEQMRMLVVHHGPAVFLGAAMEFLKAKSWEDDGHSKNSFFAWEPLCEAFVAYLDKYREFVITMEKHHRRHPVVIDGVLNWVAQQPRLGDGATE